ncbi:MAG: thiamine phosphate synthase [Clostridiales bacterium]
MKLSKADMLLYAVTDRTWLNGKTLAATVEEILKSGITFLQLREKELDYDDFLTEALAIGALAKKYNVPFVINDDVKIAMAANTDGVHVGQDDGNVAVLRKEIGDKILGVSVHTVEQALKAQEEGADYLGVGAMFATDTKTDATVVSKDTLKAIGNAVDIPVVIIGGVNKDTIPQFKNCGAHGAAVVSAIFAQKNPVAATKELVKLCSEVF